MNKLLLTLVFAFVLTVPLSYAGSAFAITLTPIGSGFNQIIGIDHYEPANQVVISVNYPTGLPYNFELVASDGTRTQYSTITGLTDEVKVASAKDDGGGMSIGGFAPGTLFTGTGTAGEVTRIAPGGSQPFGAPWVTLPAEPGLLRGSTYVDRTGIFGGDLIVVTTTGGVWQVTSTGIPTKLAQIGPGTTHLEGVITVPNDSVKYGPWAGKILAGAEALGLIYSIDIFGTVDSFDLNIDPEDFDIIPFNQNFFGVNFPNQLLGAPPSEFVGMVGDFIITQEFPGILWHVKWDTNTNQFVTQNIAQVTQWEHVTFSPAGILEIPQIPVGGEIIPIDATSLILAGAQTPSVWMVSALSALGVGAFLFTRNPSNVRNIKVILQDYLDRL